MREEENIVGRRDFLALGGLTAAALSGAVLSLPVAEGKSVRVGAAKRGKTVPTICPYCAVGCGMLVTVADGKVVNVEGDPLHPINQGALCSKGNAYLQLINSDRRLKYPMVRTNPKKGVGEDPGWKRISWDEAFTIISRKIVEAIKSNYHNWVKHKDGYYWLGKDSPIAFWGSAYFNNEECYLVKKMATILGSLNTDHQARLCHAPTVPALSSVFGFGAQTHHPIDLKNAKCLMIIGSNAAEQHPIVFRWVQKAHEAGAKIISLDPRFTRSSSWADLYAAFRPGSETAIYLGMVRYAIKNNLYDRELLRTRTNAPYNLEGVEVGLDSPDSIFSMLKKIVEPYTPEEVSRITGIPKEKFIQVCETYLKNGPGSILYSMGTTQHTNATYSIRAMAILQLVAGYVGKPGAQLAALRGISNVQGSSDMNLLAHLLMGYRVPPRNARDIREYQKWKNNKDGYVKSLQEKGMVAYWRWGPARMFPTWEWLEQCWGVFSGTYPGVDPDNEPVVSDIPLGVGLPTVQMFRAIMEGKIKVLINLAGNTAVSLANAGYNVHEALSNPGLFMVCLEIFETETAHFADILLPGTVPVERSGSLVNTGRWVQWRWKAVDPPGECMDELSFLTELFKRVRAELVREGLLLPSELFEKERGVQLNRVRNPYTGALGVDENWPTSFTPKATPEAVYKEIAHTNALYRFPAPGKKFSAYDLETAPDLDGIMAKRRDPTPADEYDRKYGLFKNWAWAWMTNQRNLYDLNEPPEDKNRVRGFFVWWAHSKDSIDKPGGVWLGLDKAAIWAGGPTGLYDPTKPDWHPLKHGLPLHNEPVESPDPELAEKYPPVWDDRFPVKKGSPKEFPAVLTTFRLTEHMQAGAMTRNLPWLVELHPEMFVEISREHAAELGVKSGDMIRVVTARGAIEVKAVVTDRIKPLNINGKKVHVVAAPWHWGFKGLSTGAIANIITMDAVDPHGNIPETKACLCRVEKVR